MTAMAVTTQQEYGTGWYLDSGATNHLTPDVNTLPNPTDYTSHDEVHISNGTGLLIKHVGQSFLPSQHSTRLLKLKQILHVLAS